MPQKRKKRAPTRKSNDTDFNELLGEALKYGISVAVKGLEFVEGIAENKQLHKTYPYLREAMDNVKNVVGFFHSTLGLDKPKRTKKDERKDERKKGKKGHKKVSKPKTVRHKR